jgi:Winged helix DNA-binding domain
VRSSYDGAMTSARLLGWRLASPYLDGRQAGDPARILRHFGAVQAQEYGQSLWAVGLRTRGATAATVEAAIENGSILRTWPMRGTIHLVPAEDTRWMLDLLAGRRIQQMATVYRRLGLTGEVLGRAAEIVAGELRGGRRIRRPDLLALLVSRGIDCSASPHGSRGSHILGYLSMTGLVCIGPMDGAQQTFVLLDEWAPDPRTPEDPAAELAARYFTSHGPATVRDFGWWSGLPLGQVRPAIERAGSALAATELGGEMYWHGAGRPGPAPGDAGLAAGGALLLPAFDEYTVAYKDRDALLADGHQLPPGDLLNPVMLLHGHAVGLWKRVIIRDGAQLTLAPFQTLASGDRDRFTVAAERYAAFLGLPAEITSATPAQVRRQRRQ